jgi:hypothetical protein
MGNLENNKKYLKLHFLQTVIIIRLFLHSLPEIYSFSVTQWSIPKRGQVKRGIRSYGLLVFVGHIRESLLGPARTRHGALRDRKYREVVLWRGGSLHVFVKDRDLLNEAVLNIRTSIVLFLGG